MSAHTPTSARRALLRLNEAGEPNLSGLTYWEVEQIRYPDRTWYEVRRDGWCIAEVYVGSDGWRVASRPREPIPAAVLAEMPTACMSVLSENTQEDQ
jgi:hypothetical protein